MENFLKRLEELLKTHLKETYLPPHRARTPGWTHHDLKFFAKGADLLSTAFTEGRAELPKNYFNRKEYRSGFLLYYVLPTFVKVWKCLEQLPPYLKDHPLKILDLGSGPGTVALACSAFFADQPLEILAFEQNRIIGRDAMALWKKWAPSHHRCSFIHQPIPNQKIDLAFASYFFTEIPRREQLNWSREILNKTALFIIVEPATQQGTRQLMTLRDEILRSGFAQVLAPCLHQQNCPMLAANRRDWCHFYIDWKCPALIRQIDQITGNKHDYLKMAYMILGRTADYGLRTTDLWRVVSSPLISKGKKEFNLCGSNGKLQKIGRLDRHKNQFPVFDRIQRGDVLSGRLDSPNIAVKKF
ncbi:MAG: hypothetical protein HY466_05875 [Deltaproteobacteria bacterium]|nr:hypothetical protein [Deltaproteobacteria bacterium]